MIGRPREDEVDRFWSKVEKSNGCWTWSAATVQGYGVFSITQPRRQVKAHRMSFALANGLDIRDLDAEVIMHTCDNPQCVNPAHLLVGTNATNMEDRDRKGRGADRRGSLCPTAKLSWPEVHRIRAAYGPGTTLRDLAYKFNVSPKCIHNVVTNKTWKYQ